MPTGLPRGQPEALARGQDLGLGFGMLHMLFSLPLSDFKSVRAPEPIDVAASAEMVLPSVAGLGLAALAVGLVLFGVWLWLGFRRRPALPVPPKNWILVDGSNVMHWQDNAPKLGPLLLVIEDLKARGFAPGIVFDANAGHKLFGKYLNESELSWMLTLPRDQLLVVPKGTPADPYILDTARRFKAQIVTNDRYRDWVADYPEVAEPGLLIWGGIKDGKLWLRYPDLAPGTARPMAVATVG